MHIAKNRKFEIFISYRRKGGYDTAKLVYDRLRIDGYSVSFDIDTLVNGNFDNELEQRVNDCKDFLLVLSPGVFDRFFESDPNYDPENDWVRREIACALKTNKNIIPLVLEGFTFPKSLPEDVKDITRKNAIDFYPKYFEAAYEKTKSFLISKPSWAVKHKKKILSFTFIAFFALAVFSYLMISQKDSDLQAALQKAEVEKDTERTRVLDSIQQRREQRRLERTYHWNAPADEAVGQVIFEKIAEVGIQKTECSDNGIILMLNTDSLRYRESEKKIICSYSPRIKLKPCNRDATIDILENGRFKTEPNKDSISAKEELLNKLREADFSNWVAKINELNKK
jgi:hypothetical protein